MFKLDNNQRIVGRTQGGTADVPADPNLWLHNFRHSVDEHDNPLTEFTLDYVVMAIDQLDTPRGASPFPELDSKVRKKARRFVMDGFNRVATQIALTDASATTLQQIVDVVSDEYLTVAMRWNHSRLSEGEFDAILRTRLEHVCN